MFSHFRFSLFKTLTSIGLAIVCFTASHWQWGRYLEKQTLVDTYAQHSTAHAEVWPEEANPEAFEKIFFKKLSIKGKFDFEHQRLLLNRRHASGPGHWLLTPFFPEGSKTAVMVSRGFIPYADSTPDTWNKYHEPESAELYVVLQPTVEKRSFLSPNAQSHGSTKDYGYFYADLEKIAEGLPFPINTKVYLQRLGDGPLLGFPKEAVSIEVPPSTHYWYSYEWILLGLLSLFLGFTMQALPKRVKPTLPQLLSLLFSTLLLAQLGPEWAHATAEPEKVPQLASIIEHLGQTIRTADFQFRDESGAEKPLSEFFIPGKPLIIAPVYFECPRLCTLTQEGLLKALNAVDLELGKDFRVLSISFNAQEGAKLAQARQEKYYSGLVERQRTNDGWKFMTGNEGNTSRLMNSLGFSFAEDKGEYVHAAVLIILSPEGMISRYIYGIDFPERDLRFALVEASEGRIGSSLDKLLLFCFRYDHLKGKYTLAVWNIIRAVCSVFVLLLFGALIRMRLRENVA